MDPLKMYFLLKMGIFHGYVSLQEGNFYLLNSKRFFLGPCYWESVKIFAM